MGFLLDEIWAHAAVRPNDRWRGAGLEWDARVMRAVVDLFGPAAASERPPAPVRRSRIGRAGGRGDESHKHHP